MTKTEWLEACAAKFIEAGFEQNPATEMASSCLDNTIRAEGSELAALETSPADAAGVEMGYWEE